MRKLIPLIILFCLNFGFGQLNRAVQMEDFQRDDGNLYAWVFFTDKKGDSENIQISERSLNRRNKADSDKDYSWYDAYPSNSYVNSIVNIGANLRSKSRWFNAITIECNEEQFEQILLLPFVKDVQPLRQYRKSLPNNPDDNRIIGNQGLVFRNTVGHDVHEMIDRFFPSVRQIRSHSSDAEP